MLYEVITHIFVTIIALAFTLFTHWNLAYSIKIMADIPTAFAFVLAIYSYLKKRMVIKKVLIS